MKKYILRYVKKGSPGFQHFGRRGIEEHYSGKKNGEIPQVGTKLEMYLEIKYRLVLFFQESRHKCANEAADVSAKEVDRDVSSIM